MNCSGWTTDELFTYAISQGLIEPEASFEDWKNDRTDLYAMVQDDLDNDPHSCLYEIGDEVYWTDPDEGQSSGVYKILAKLTDDGEDSVYLISNGTSESEVYEHELS